MDPLSQGVIGASVAQSTVKNKRYLVSAGILGFLSGMAPDLDIFIRSEQDPLLFLEYHRQFSHSLVFIPIGGLICASILFFILRLKKSLSFKQAWIFSTLGYGTHGLLDACTSYGTLLLWPFSYSRISWNNISIIDPRYQVPGKQLLRNRYGYTRNEILDLDQTCGELELKIDRVQCHYLELIENVDDFAAFMKRLKNIAAVDFIVECKSLDDNQLTKEITRAYFMINKFTDSRLYVDPLIDMDRSMDVTHGLLDTHCNPRPQFLAMKSLMSLLQLGNVKDENFNIEISREYEKITCSTIDGGKKRTT